MTESIVISVGQCGNQIASRFWSLALQEIISLERQSSVSTESINAFFYEKENSKHDASSTSLKVNKHLRARAILIDMEEGVLKEMSKQPIGSLFESNMKIVDSSGSGNNWAVGHLEYGPRHKARLIQLLRREIEKCDCLQSVFVLHSMGGGTGSGFGTFALKLIKEEFEGLQRFVIPIYSTAQDDVITAPYNSVLATKLLNECAECVIPVENQALLKIFSRFRGFGSSSTLEQIAKDDKSYKRKAYDSMNEMVAKFLLDLTSSSRLPGPINVDLNEILTNLVPFPRLHYLSACLGPLPYLLDTKLPFRSVNDSFKESLGPPCQLWNVGSSQSSKTLCSAVLARGQLSLSSVRTNLERFSNGADFVSWNPDGTWKFGLCSIPPRGYPYSILGLSNASTCAVSNLSRMRNSFALIYKRRAHLHHYLQVEGMDESILEDSFESLNDLISGYEEVANRARSEVPRLRVA